MKIEEFKNYLKINIDSQNTRRQYLSRLSMFFNEYGEFNQLTVNDFLATCVDKELKAHTFNGYMNALKHYSKFIKLDIEFPKQKRAEKTEQGSLTMDEIEKEILPYFQYIFKKPELKKLVFRLLFTSGMRPFELINLKKEGLNYKDGYIHITKTKNKKARMTLLAPSLQSDLKKQCESSNTEYIFNITNAFIVNMFKSLNENLNYKNHLHAYMLRHGFANHCVKNGIPMPELQKYMGHWDISMTMNYIKNIQTKEDIKIGNKKFKFKKGEK